MDTYFIIRLTTMQEIKIAGIEDIKRLSSEDAGGTLINVLTAEQHAEAHIPGSGQACVFETVFIDNVRKLAPDRHAAVLVYGAGNSFDVTVAAAKLMSAGYSDVRVFPGGIDEWRAAGLPLRGNTPDVPCLDYPPILPLHARYTLMPKASTLRWTGRNDITSHWGAVPLSSGVLHFKNTGQTLEADGCINASMSGITCEDLAADPAGLRELLAHLASEDFFRTRLFPRASLKIGELTPLEGAGHGLPNYHGKALLTICGCTQMIESSLSLRNLPEGGLSLSGLLSVDRTNWGVLYGSARFFRFLGKHKVDDLITLDAKMIFEKG